MVDLTVAQGNYGSVVLVLYIQWSNKFHENLPSVLWDILLIDKWTSS